MYELNSDTVSTPSRSLRQFVSYFQLGERQKRHLQTLEALLAPQTPQNEDHILLPNSQEGNDLADRLFQRTAGYSSTSFTTPPSRLSGLSLRTAQDDPMKALAFIVDHLGEIDESTSARIGSGQVTIRDILQAGLSSLYLPSGESSTENCAKDNDQPSPALCTDRILITKNRKLVHSHSLPSVYTNNLRLKQFSTFAAIRANAELFFGLTFEELTNPATGSPFYNAALGKDGTKSVSPKLLESMPHLKPIDIQFTHPHHAYIDLIPCPKFRQRFIQLATMDPPMISMHEFCVDLENEGLICWASHIGDSNEVSGSGAPWDIRSWEAQPWFLKKWWFVLGGEEGGFFQQSRWWHEVRGDHLPSFWRRK
ncbi:hypothetical protein N7510_011327 [Penicillium lagena]|uniref:uncharacterized protein n=1 Tax=Penicillium lagena TaxID=94218 RepID=UPI002541B219|nr:uncharacterized protein N7510_011327 [Penicillium lagena]KAJ5601793.1 hypothetical protein N7510_011327 [Penicillium lagena]